MKPFDLEQALAGAPVQTRDGRPVTQLVKFDLPEKGVVRLVGVTSGRHIERWYPNGSYEFHDHSQNDLLMAPIKKTGWVARFRYAHCSGSYSFLRSAQRSFVDGVIYGSEEDVKAAEPNALSYHEISWEEE